MDPESVDVSIPDPDDVDTDWVVAGDNDDNGVGDAPSDVNDADSCEEDGALDLNANSVVDGDDFGVKDGASNVEDGENFGVKDGASNVEDGENFGVKDGAPNVEDDGSDEVVICPPSTESTSHVTKGDGMTFWVTLFTLGLRLRSKCFL
mgnify:CR=1 FL=1